jgi:hypothetical protein
VLSIPELSINPLAKRLAYMFDSINFKEFLVGGQAAGAGRWPCGGAPPSRTNNVGAAAAQG